MDTLRRLARYLHIPLRAHHVTVHANGRCFILGKAVKRFRIPSGQPCVRVQLSGGQATLVFGPDGNALRHPGTRGKQYPGLYFYSRRLSRVAGPFPFRRPRDRLPRRHRPHPADADPGQGLVPINNG